MLFYYFLPWPFPVTENHIFASMADTIVTSLIPPRVTFRIGTHWGWRHNCHGHERVVIVDDTKKVKEESAEEIMAQIEKMAELKEKGLITEKEYEKKKKELLKRI